MPKTENIELECYKSFKCEAEILLLFVRFFPVDSTKSVHYFCFRKYIVYDSHYRWYCDP